MEVAAMLFALLADPNVTYTHNHIFPDVNYNDPLQVNIVNFVASRGYMIGDDRGHFRTNDPISRAVVAVIITEVLDLLSQFQQAAVFTPATGWGFPTAFPDTANHWANGFVWCAVQVGILRGFDDGTFRPDDYVTRAQLAAIFYNTFDRSGAPMGNANFVDVPPTHWAYRAVMNAAVPSW